MTCNEFVVLFVLSMSYYFIKVESEMRSPDEKTCAPGFVCVHGYCDKPRFYCVCDSGWKQPFCETSECKCVDGESCVFQNGVYRCEDESNNYTPDGTSIGNVTFDSTSYRPSYMDNGTTVSPSNVYCVNNSGCEHGVCEEARCICDSNWAGNRCEKHCPRFCFPPKACVYHDGQLSCEIINKTINDITTNTVAVEGTTVNKPVDIQARNVCSHLYLTRPVHERECMPNGFRCHFGVCNAIYLPTQIEMNCTCDPGSYGGQCDKICCRDCSPPYGSCRLNETGHEYCDCQHDYTGKHCERMRPTNDKDFDAFVSYRSSEADEEFVYKRLYPKLEKEMGFKLCLHYRDFIPGDTIANNIIWAINNSRRTIIVISQQYIQSDFTRFEYQVAQTEMLKRKHKIIPVLLEDINHVEHEMDENLKIIIESVTYIKWPGENTSKALDQFWKQLHLSLPKKHKQSSSSPFSFSNSISSFRLSDKGSQDIVSETILTKSVKPEKNPLVEILDSGSYHSYCDDRDEGSNDDDNENSCEVQIEIDIDQIEVKC
ncbi:neurogenic locus notch homolog protein 2-like isoform X2 [Mytilus californianus]|uniref:neurogenic locus notch homolog protein 2-like isoform X2 n=1 Tax=Mytilus californianus TaxID=6549 RepID=UPI002247E591|nr:neurogenic locus notch homolog protein 2-like isoform X2 [Mytilus californianus]